MRSFREVLGGLLIATISIGTVLGGIFLAISESGIPIAAVTPTPSATAPQTTGQLAPVTATVTPSLTQPSTSAPSETPSLIPTDTPLPTLTDTVLPTQTLTATPCLPPLNWTLYTVQRGDTLFELSQRFGQSLDSIRQANCLPDVLLKAGQKIYLPRLAPTATPVVAVSPAETATPEATATLFAPIPQPLQIFSITIAGVVRDSSSPGTAIVSIKVEVTGGLLPYSIFEDSLLKSGNPYTVVTQCNGTLVHTVQVVSADGQGAQQAYFFSPIVCP